LLARPDFAPSFAPALLPPFLPGFLPPFSGSLGARLPAFTQVKAVGTHREVEFKKQKLEYQLKNAI